MAAISLDPNVKRTLSVEEFCEVAEVCRSTGYSGRERRIGAKYPHRWSNPHTHRSCSSHVAA